MEERKNNIALMAFSQGQESKESGAPSKIYEGVGSVKVVAVNPTKKELEEIYGTELDNEPTYVGESERDGKKTKYARVAFVLETVPENNSGIEARSTMSLFIRNEGRFNKDMTKIQVIDKYGQTAWVTKEELENHSIPQYANGPAGIDKDYRPLYAGEEELTNFFIALLNIPRPWTYNRTTKQRREADDKSLCLARFDHIDKVFSGDFSECVDAWKLQKNNKVKVLFGVRKDKEGMLRQDFYTRMFLRNGNASYERLADDVKATKEAGSFPNSEFKCVPLREHTVEETPLNESASIGANPFGDNKDNPFFNGEM